MQARKPDFTNISQERATRWKDNFYFSVLFFLFSFFRSHSSVSRKLHVFKLPIQLTFFASRVYSCVETRRHICHHKDRNVLPQTNKTRRPQGLYNWAACDVTNPNLSPFLSLTFQVISGTPQIFRLLNPRDKKRYYATIF